MFPVSWSLRSSRWKNFQPVASLGLPARRPPSERYGNIAHLQPTREAGISREERDLSMTEKSPDRLEVSWGNFRASAVGKLAVSGLLLLVVGVFVSKALGVL